MILLDENRASHVALGFGFPTLVEPVDHRWVSESGDHLDVTIGSDQIEATGIDAGGRQHHCSATVIGSSAPERRLAIDRA